MKVIIAGSRAFSDYQAVIAAVAESKFHVTEVVSGGASGVDRFGERYAEEHGLALRRFPAAWDIFGKSAGPKRNAEMANYADELIAIKNGDVSKGTDDMIAKAKLRKLKVFVKVIV